MVQRLVARTAPGEPGVPVADIMFFKLWRSTRSNGTVETDKRERVNAHPHHVTKLRVFSDRPGLDSSRAHHLVSCSISTHLTDGRTLLTYGPP